MSAENPSEQLPQNPEQKEWEGQRWDYLVLECFDEAANKFVGKTVKTRSSGLFMADTDAGPMIAHYNQKLETKKATPITEALKIVGDDGWELVSNMTTRQRGPDGRQNFLIFKRPKISEA